VLIWGSFLGVQQQLSNKLHYETFKKSMMLDLLTITYFHKCDSSDGRLEIHGPQNM
jgi:hypothetical protein